MKQEKIFGDLGYAVIAEVQGTSVCFSIHPGSVHQEAQLEGYIKYDGCSNWHLSGNNYQLHFCSQLEASQFGLLLSRLYDWAADLLPEYSGNKNDRQR